MAIGKKVKLSLRDKWALGGDPVSSAVFYPITAARAFTDPNAYTRYNQNAFQKFITGKWANPDDQDEALLNALSESVKGKSYESYWNSLTPTEQYALAENLYNDAENGLYNWWGLKGKAQVFDKDAFDKYMSEFDSIAAKPTRDFDTNSIWDTVSKDIAREDEAYLGSLNEDLTRLGDAYNANRNSLLSSQFQNNASTMDAMTSEMSRARRNAIEAGASAGVRIAGNVNAVLSAQNKMSQTSLDTSNQLAQMLLNQRNAESGLRQQYRDYKADSYNRVSERANAEYNRAENAYQDRVNSWQDNFDKNVSETNPFQDSMSKYRNKTAY